MKVEDREKFGIIIHKLKDHCIEIVNISFDGRDDSGSIHDVECKSGDAYVEVTSEFQQMIEDIGYEILVDTVQQGYDWYNNEGGFGDIKISVNDHKFDINYHQRTTEEFNWEDEKIRVV